MTVVSASVIWEEMNLPEGEIVVFRSMGQSPGSSEVIVLSLVVIIDASSFVS